MKTTFRRTMLICCACLFTAGINVGLIRAADFEKMPVAEVFAKDAKAKDAYAKDKSAIVKSQSNELTGDTGKRARQYYAGFVIPMMTDETQCERMRKEVLSDLATAKGKEVREFIILSVVDPLKKLIAEPKYHPATRASALLLLSDLDTEALDPTRGVPPKPYAPAMQTLLTILKTPTLDDGLRAAALVGINRHVRYSSATWRDNAREQVASAILDFIREPKAVKRSERADSFIKRRGIDTLALFTSPKHPEVRNELVKMASDFKLPLEVRLHVFRSLNRFGVDTLDEETQKKLFIATAHLVQVETNNWLLALQGPEITGMAYPGAGGSGRAPGSMGGGGGSAGQAAGFDADMYGKSMGGGNKGKKDDEKIVLNDTQDLEVRTARRELYLILESAYETLHGKRFDKDKKGSGKGLLVFNKDEVTKANGIKLTEQLDAVAKALGDDTVTDKDSLLKVIEKPIIKLYSTADTFAGLQEYAAQAPSNTPVATESADKAPEVAAPAGDQPPAADAPANDKPADGEPADGAAAPSAPEGAPAGDKAAPPAGGAPQR